MPADHRESLPASTFEPDAAVLSFGEWSANRSSGELTGPLGIERLEPKVMELLFLLGRFPQSVVPREEILAQLWPGVVVGEDTLSRAVFKLRKALADDVKAPRFIETIPKRGYRFIFQDDALSPAPETASPTLPSERPQAWPWRAIGAVGILTVSVSLGWVAYHRRTQARPTDANLLVDRANDYYFQYSRVDNEAAIELFERVVAQHPDHAPAYAGLANAYAQRVVRWPTGSREPGKGFTSLGEALKHGHTRTPEAIQALLRATRLAEQAVVLAPKDASAHKALGFVRSAREDFAGALAAYHQAVAMDPDAWGPLINIGDILEIQGQQAQAMPYFEAAFEAMTRVYSQQAARIRPWYAELALLLGDRHLALGHVKEAEAWFRKTLETAPFHPKGTAQLAGLLRRTQRQQEADRLMAHFRQALGPAQP